MFPIPKIISKPNIIQLDQGVDIIKLFQVIESKSQNCFLLESLAHLDFESRYTILGFDPSAIVFPKDKNTLCFQIQESDDFENINSAQTIQIHSENPYFELKNIINPQFASEGYFGGLVGFLGYDLINYLEPTAKVSQNEDYEAFKFGIYFDGIVLDKYTNRAFYFYYNTSRIEYIYECLESEFTAPTSQTRVFCKGDSITKIDHQNQVNSIKNEIILGNTFQCELGFRRNYKITGNKLNIYKELREMNPSPYMYFLKFGEQYLIGASPELLFSLKNGQMQTSPAAGTAKRGSNEEEDKALCYKLLNNPKEVAEHLMLVDMHRNDIGKSAKIGSVGVQRLMDIRKFPFVQHIVSDIVGTIDDDKDMFDGIGNILPGGVLTGAPKLESIKIIENNEKDPRGPYGGGIGMFGFDSNCTFCITIRGLFINNNDGYVMTCSGIVLDSEAEDEYNELIHKLEGMQKTLSKFTSQIQI
jgi:anthranilate synthase component I